MTTIAIVFMIFGFGVTLGGLAVTLVLDMKSKNK